MTELLRADASGERAGDPVALTGQSGVERAGTTLRRSRVWQRRWLREHASDGWRVLSLPAIAELGDLLGRAEGEPLWPRHLGLEELDRRRNQMGSQMWLAEYQQRPVADEGGIFKEAWWNYFDERPASFRRVVFSIDSAPPPVAAG